jgi:hypothetical protein
VRAREFTINIPIHITLNGDGDPEINTGKNDDPKTVLDQNPVMVPPLQQGLELAKATLGKESPVIGTLTKDEPEIGKKVNPGDSDSVDLERIKTLISPSPAY